MRTFANCASEACPAPSHDTYSAYHYGCRSEAATEGHRLYEKRRRQRRNQPALVTSVGAVRRLRALAVLGWTTAAIAERMGGDANAKWVSLLLRDQRPRIARTTDELVRVVFAELAMSPGNSAHAANRAKAKGWFPPLAWTDLDNPDEQPDLGGVDTQHDENVVAAVLAGRATWASMTRPDREHLVTTLFARGWETAVIAERARGDVLDVRRVLDSARAKRKRAAA